jgi:hypothetical protein
MTLKITSSDLETKYNDTIRSATPNALKNIVQLFSISNSSPGIKEKPQKWLKRVNKKMTLK